MNSKYRSHRSKGLVPKSVILVMLRCLITGKLIPEGEGIVIVIDCEDGTIVTPDTDPLPTSQALLHNAKSFLVHEDSLLAKARLASYLLQE